MVITPFFFFSGATAVDQLPQSFGGPTTFPPFYAFSGFTPADEVVDEPTGQVESVGGWVRARRGPNRRRFILPDGTIVWATFAEIEELLSQLVEVEEPKKKPRKRSQRAPEQPLVVWEAIRYEKLSDASVETLRPVLPPLMSWGPDRAKLETAVRAFKRRQDDEEAMFALGL